MNKKICVIGSSNIDQFSYISEFPSSGETLIGDSFETGFGGKGANQAVMAGLLGADVYMISCLGNDIFGDSTINNFIENNVNCLLYTSPSPRDATTSRMPSSA